MLKLYGKKRGKEREKVFKNLFASLAICEQRGIKSGDLKKRERERERR